LSNAVLPEGVSDVSVDVMPVDSGSENSEDYQQAKLLISGDSGGLQNLVLYDLKLVDQNGNPIEKFNGTVTVKMRIPAGMSGSLRVYWVNPETQELEDMNAVVDGEYLVFDTSHFSYYAIAELSEQTETESGGFSFWWLLLLVPVVLVGAVFLGKARKKHR